MKKLILAGLSCAGLVALLPETGYAHGGQYRGPGDVVPPSPGGGRGTGPGGPSTPGPGGPSTPGPAGPATPGPAGPATGGPAGPAAGGRGPATGGRGIQLTDDLTRWEFWWEFNKDPFIRLREAIHAGSVQTGSDEFFLGATRKVESKDSLKPSEEDRVGNILPALKKAIDSTDQRDINSSCMVAMAKVGKDAADFKLREVFLPRLKNGDQEISEVAALSFGIAALEDEENLKVLTGLATNDQYGKSLVSGGDVNDRTRAFACYGLGLIAYPNANIAFKRKAYDALKSIIEDDKMSSRDIKVAAVNGMGLLNADDSDEGKKLKADALQVLEAYFLKPLGSGNQILQSHCPPAIAKILGNNYHDEKVVEDYKKMFAAELAGKSKVKQRASDDIPRACALALGQICKPIEDEKSPDADYAKTLLDAWHENKDQQTKFFSMLAIGQIGGKWARSTLLKEWSKARENLEKPWVAMAMGCFAFEKYAAEKAATGGAPTIEVEFGRHLQKALDDIKDPSPLSAIAVALGLVQYTDAADDLRALLAKKANNDELAGYLCIGLALMNDQRSKDEINQVVQKSLRRPELLKQAAIALGKLGDKQVADELQKLLADSGDANLAKLAAVASALGFIGDRRTIEPIKKMLFDQSLTDISRAFAAVALGGVADKEDLPWNSKIGQNINYRGAVDTLTDKRAGILDIL